MYMVTVEVLGMPKSGKSTVIETAESILKHERGLDVRTIYEGARVCPLEKKGNRFMYNAWSFQNTTNRILEAQRSTADIILIDRGVVDHIAFNLALFKSGKITEEQYSANDQYYHQFASLEDKVCSITLDPHVAIERETRDVLLSGSVMNLGFLDTLDEAYAETIASVDNILVLSGEDSREDNINSLLEYVGYKPKTFEKAVPNIRVSCAKIAIIEVNGKYALIKSRSSAIPKYSSIGGHCQCGDRERSWLEMVYSATFENDSTDLMLTFKKGYLKEFYEWYDTRTDSDSIDRELTEELVEENKILSDLSGIEIEHLGQSNPRDWTTRRGLNWLETKYFIDVYKVKLTSTQQDEFERFAEKDNTLVLLTKDQLSKKEYNGLTLQTDVMREYIQ